MKLWGVSMVRNESDIVEAFVRHNLSVLDGLVVVDHGSSDATLPILMALCAERLPLVVMRNESVGYLQAEIVTSAVRAAFARFGTDAVFVLDADEFLRVRSRATLEGALAAIPPGHFGRIRWPTYVPRLDGPAPDMVALLRSTRRWPAKLPYPPNVSRKVVLTRHFEADASATVTMGNHDVMLGRNPRSSPRMTPVDLPRETVEVCHVPIRSVAQFVVKTAVKRLARIAAGRDYPAASAIHAALDAIRHGGALSPTQMLRTHILVDDASFARLWNEAPADDPFVADITLRHTPATPMDPVPVVLAAVASLVRRAVDARAGRVPAAPAPGVDAA